MEFLLRIEASVPAIVKGILMFLEVKASSALTALNIQLLQCYMMWRNKRGGTPGERAADLLALSSH